MRSDSFKVFIYKMCLQIIYLLYIYKKDLALNYLQWLICHKTKPDQSNLKSCTLWQKSGFFFFKKKMCISDIKIWYFISSNIFKCICLFCYRIYAKKKKKFGCCIIYQIYYASLLRTSQRWYICFLFRHVFKLLLIYVIYCTMRPYLANSE